MDVVDYTDYFKQFAGDEKICKSFYEIDLLDMKKATEDIRGGEYKDDILILEDFTVGTVAKNMDQINDKFFGALLVVGKYGIRGGTSQEKQDLKNRTFNEIVAIREAMIADKRRGCNLMSGLELNNFLIEKVGPILDQDYGWRLSFELLIVN